MCRRVMLGFRVCSFVQGARVIELIIIFVLFGVTFIFLDWLGGFID